MKELIVLSEVNEESYPEVYKAGGLKKYIDQVRENVKDEVPDISTKEGRDRIKSQAFKVAKSKTAIENPGREYLKKIKELPKEIEKELREFVLEMDALRDDVRRPLTEFEEKEAARIEYHEAEIKRIKDFGTFVFDSVVDADSALSTVSNIVINDDCQEFAGRYTSAKNESIALLTETIAKLTQRDNEKAELEKLRKESEENARKERERKIAEDARLQAEREALEREEKAKAEQAAALLKIEQERKQAELDAIAREEKLKRDNELALQRAEQEKQAAIIAERKRNEAEAMRIANEIAQAEREAEKAASNKAHQKEVNNAILEKLVAIGLTEDMAKMVITAAAKKELANMIINY